MTGSAPRAAVETTLPPPNRLAMSLHQPHLNHPCLHHQHLNQLHHPRQRQPRQPVERRNLRRHESRARYSELVKVCDEVVRAAGVCGTKSIDPRKKCVDGMMPITTVHEQRRGTPLQPMSGGAAAYRGDPHEERRAAVPAPCGVRAAPRQVLARKQIVTLAKGCRQKRRVREK